MYTLIFENDKKNKIELSNHPCIQIHSIDGLHPVEAMVNMSKLIGVDGASVNSATIDERIITIIGTLANSVEKTRIELYRYIKPKRKGKVYFKNNYRNVYTDVIIDTFEIDQFTNPQLFQIVMRCPNPYFMDVHDNKINTSVVEDCFEFVFENPVGETFIFGDFQHFRETNVVYQGDVEEDGMTIEIRASGRVIEPRIINVETLEYMQINYTLQRSDILKINTHRGNKSIILVRDNQEFNLFNHLRLNDSIGQTAWLMLQVGDNLFAFSAKEGDVYMDITFKTTTKYTGV